MNKTKRIVPSKRGDDFFDFLVTASGILVLIVLGGIILSLIYASWPSISRFGLSFLWNKEWDTNADLYGALVPIYGTLVTSAVALIIAVPVSFGIAIFLTELSPNWLKKPMGIAIELLAAIPSIVYGMWGLFIFSPLFAMYFQIPLDDILSNVPILNIFFTGPAFGLGLLAAGIILAIMIIPYISSVMRDVFEQTPVLMKEAAYGVGCTTWECMRHIVLPYTKNGVIGGIMLGLGRALGETMAVTFVIGNTFQLDSFSLFETGNTITSVLANEFAEAGKELHVSSLMELGLILFGITFIVLAYSKYLVSKLNKIEEPKDKSAFKTWLPRLVWLVIFGLFLYFSFTQFDEESQSTVFKWLDAFYACLIIVLAVVVCWALKTLFRLIDLEFRRKLLNKIALFVAFSAMVFGCIWLVWILFSTIEQGIAGLSLSVFTEMTPPPMEAGGLANAIVGSLILIFFATLLGTPLGILAGIYLAEYGKNNALASVIRFINDVLLSAPSIIIGLFVYMIFVVNMGHYSGIAGFVALAIIQIPIVVRTTENMLNLVPNTLREAAYALGSPRWKVISSITLKASYSGIMTGILLAIARISGETAPLLFTSLSNQFWSTDITQPIASLPVTIFKFAMSPYQNWQSLAWVSVLLITGFVLVLNILARFLFNQKS